MPLGSESRPAHFHLTFFISTLSNLGANPAYLWCTLRVSRRHIGWSIFLLSSVAFFLTPDPDPVHN